MTKLHLLSLQEPARWNQTIRRAGRYDFYHLASYHELARQNGEGEPLLFVLSGGEAFVALPLLIRSLDGTVEGLRGEGLRDATSVYGYPGPLVSGENARPLLAPFMDELASYCDSRGILSVFSRLHPLLPRQDELLSRGEVVPLSETVSVDLSMSLDEQWRQHRKNHKRGINKLKRDGFCCLCDTRGDWLAAFVEAYYENMERVQAGESYFFPRGYFEDFLRIRDFTAKLFVCTYRDELAAAGIFTLCGDVVQYHLGATRGAFLSAAPMKLVFDTVRRWSCGKGASRFHLGGGVGNREDSLFFFKAGFSGERHDFKIWKWIVDPRRYDDLLEQRCAWKRSRGLAEPRREGFFPAYRA
ncbi:MAG: GNAT family N-acetyltransferase [Synergistales bacterium]|nr:GNAT family N-acetyltransferase [Synergistales bacterium]